MYFKPSELAVNKSYFTYLLLIVIVIYGLVSYVKLPKEWSPDIQIPMLYLVVPYPGSTATDVENLVTYKLEKELKGLDQLKEISSHSSAGFATIQLEFEIGFEIDEAKNQVRTAWDNVSSTLPEDVENIEIEEINFSEEPIMILTLSGEASLFELKKITEDVQDKVEAIPGTLESDLVGGLEREIQVNVDPYLLDYYQIDLDSVSNAVANSNQDIPAGNMDVDTLKYQIRVPGMIDQVSDIENFVILSRDSTPIYTRNVAEVLDTFKEIDSVSRVNNNNAVTLKIKKKAGENLIRISDEVHAIIEDFRKLYPTINFSVYNEQGVIVKNNLSQLQNNIMISFFLVFFTLLFFMGFRSAIIVGTGIPLSMLMSFLVLYFLGISINMVVLFSLVLALGMLVDNGIVVVENMYRHLSTGKEKKDACLTGVSEVALPIIASTLTTLAAFFPLIFMPGVMGDFLKYLPITLISTLLSSLFVALIFAVTVGNSLMKVPKNAQNLEEVMTEDQIANRSWFLRNYGKILRKTIQFRYLTLLVALVTWVGSMFLYTSRGLGVIFFPESEPSSFSLNVETAPGSNFFYVSEVMGYFEELVNGFEDHADIIVANVGATSNSGALNKGEVFFEFPVDWKTHKELPSETIVRVRETLNNTSPEYGGIKWEIAQTQQGPPTGKDINIEIRGPNLNELSNFSARLQSAIADLEGLVNLQDDLQLNLSEMELKIDREKLAFYNLTYIEVANAVRMAVFGQKASTYRVGEDEYDIYVRVIEEERKNPDDLLNLRLLTRNGSVITLGQVASLQIKPAVDAIQHIDLSRVVTISADAEGVPGVTLLNQVKERLADFELPPGYNLLYTGGNEDQQESQAFLIEAFVIAVFLIFLILVAQFNSFSLPIIILFSVMMSFIGIFVGNTLHSIPFSIIMGGIGAVSLAGVVVNNSIVLIDYAEQLRAKGYGLKDAVVTSCQLRLRPVFLTAFTSIISLFPIIYEADIDFFRMKFSLSPFELDLSEIVYFGSPAGAIWIPLAFITAYGLGIATLLTLFLVPSLYCINDDIKRFFGFLKRAIGFLFNQLKPRKISTGEA